MVLFDNIFGYFKLIFITKFSIYLNVWGKINFHTTKLLEKRVWVCSQNVSYFL